MRREGSLEVSSSAIITAAVILGGCVATSGTLLFIGLLRNARAQDAMAAALVKRNSIEAQKTGEGFEAYRRGILQEAGEQAVTTIGEVRGEVAALGKAVGVKPMVIAGKLEWRVEGSVEEHGTGGIVVGPDQHDPRASDRRGLPERGTRYDDVSPTTVTNIRDMQTLGLDVRVSGVDYRDLPFDFEGAVHPGQLAEDQRLSRKLWDYALYWMQHTNPPANPHKEQRPYHPHPAYAGHTWYDAFRAMFAKTFGFGLYANIEDQFPGLLSDPRYQEFKRGLTGGNAEQ